jgi:hypothetical protein
MKILLGFAAAGLMLAAPPALAQPAFQNRPITLEPDTDEQRGYEASVFQRHDLRRQGGGQNDLAVHLYGTSSGDPAMNGLNTYIAFWQSAADGHQVFQIGDFNSYRIVSERRGEVVLEVQENTINDAGTIGNRTRRIRVSWTPPADGSSPRTIRLSAAR